MPSAFPFVVGCFQIPDHRNPCEACTHRYDDGVPDAVTCSNEDAGRDHAEETSGNEGKKLQGHLLGFRFSQERREGQYDGVLCVVPVQTVAGDDVENFQKNGCMDFDVRPPVFPFALRRVRIREEFVSFRPVAFPSFFPVLVVVFLCPDHDVTKSASSAPVVTEVPGEDAPYFPLKFREVLRFWCTAPVRAPVIPGFFPCPTLGNQPIAFQLRGRELCMAGTNVDADDGEIPFYQQAAAVQDEPVVGDDLVSGVEADEPVLEVMFVSEEEM